MFVNLPFRTLTISSLTALALSACATQQAPAPVVVGNGTAGTYAEQPSTTYTPTAPTAAVENTVENVASNNSNPYGAAPYTPSSVGNAVSNNVSNAVNNSVNSVNQTVNNSVNNAVNHVQKTATQAGSKVGNQVNKVSTYVGNYSPVDVNALTHTVEAGDTVYNISKRYGISQESLRAWNNISPDNTINKGQVLHVKAPGSKPVVAKTTQITTTTTTTTTTTSSNSNTKNIVKGATDLNLLGMANTPIHAAQDARTVDGVVWQAPVQGKVKSGFGNGNRGVQIDGQRGQPIYAAADGVVVYSNSSTLRGYGNMVIVQHQNKYLTSYANNENLLVREGHEVKRGQQIATMGSSASGSDVRLHFEIRKEGKPMNPANYVNFE